MDPNNYVAPAPGGGFVVVIGGVNKGTYPDQTSAENAYNSAAGPGSGGTAPVSGTSYATPNGQKTLQEMITGLQGAGWNGDYNDVASVIAAYNSTASGAGITGATGGTASAQKLLDAIASGDREKFDEAVKEFQQTFTEGQRQFDVGAGEKQREFNVGAGQTDRGQYSQLAQALLSTAAQLRGPKDYMQFQQYTSGGRDLMSQMYGDQPRPDFSAPTGKIEPETISDLMQKLGFTTAPGAATVPTTTGTGLGSTAVTPNVATPAPVVAPAPAPAPAPTTPLSGVKEALAPTPIAPATWGGAPTMTTQPTELAPTVPRQQTAIAPATAPTTETSPSAIPRAGANWGAPASAPKGVILPYQWHPAVWDALGPVGQGLVQSMATSQGWDWDEYLRQMNASRPVGQAPSATTTSFASPTSAYAGAR